MQEETKTESTENSSPNQNHNQNQNRRPPRPPRPQQRRPQGSQSGAQGERSSQEREQAPREHRENRDRSNPTVQPAASTSQSDVQNVVQFVWYFTIGTESVYHFVKGLYLVAYFNLYEPFQKLVTDPSSHQYFGQNLFNMAEWSWHFQYGLRGPAMIFTAWLLYRYMKYLDPFKKKESIATQNHYRQNFRPQGGRPQRY